MNVKRTLLLFLGAAGCGSIAMAVGSGGIADPSLGARAGAMANAVVASADDPSTVWFNPAGIFGVGNAASLGGTLIKSSVKYTSQTGATASKDDAPSLTPNFYLTQQLPGRFSAGLAVNSPYGLVTKWPSDGPFKTVATKSELKMFVINPAVSYAVSDMVHVAAGVDYFRVMNVSLQKAALPSGTSEVSGDGDGWGYNLGALFRLSERHSFGLTYRSEARVVIDGTTKLSGLSGPAAALFGNNYESPVKTEIRFPPSASLGYSYRPTSRLLASIAYEWVGWSVWDENNLDFSEQNPIRRAALESGNPIPRSWNDTSNVAVGAEYQLNPHWTVQGGYFYFDQVEPNKTFNPGIPENRRNGLTIGTGYRSGPWAANLGYKLLLFRDRNVSNNIGSPTGNVNGKYQSVGQTLAAGLTFFY